MLLWHKDSKKAQVVFLTDLEFRSEVSLRFTQPAPCAAIVMVCRNIGKKVTIHRQFPHTSKGMPAPNLLIKCPIDPINLHNSCGVNIDLQQYEHIDLPEITGTQWSCNVGVQI